MKNKKTLLMLIAVFVLLIVGASVLYTQLSKDAAPDQLANLPSQPSQQQYTAPNFSVYEADGKEVHLSDFFGKPIVLNFWASWCGPCQSEMPHFQEKYEALGEEVTFLMVNVTGQGNDSQANAMAFIEECGYTFPVFFDLTLDAAIAYGVTGFPMTFFIDAQGNLVTYANGAISADALQWGIDMIR